MNSLRSGRLPPRNRYSNDSLEPLLSRDRSEAWHPPRLIAGRARRMITENDVSRSVVGLWKKLDLDLHTVMMILKAAIPPTVSVAMYQSTPVAKTYSTAGYILGVISILGFPIMPRAKFVQTMLLNIFATCLAAAWGLLVIWSGVKARENSTHPTEHGYNQSASAVVGVWLFVQMYIANAVRSSSLQLQWPGMMFSVFTIIVDVYAPQFPEMGIALQFIKSVLMVFLTSYGIASVTSLFIWPYTNRWIAFGMMENHMRTMKKLIGDQSQYLFDLEQQDMFRIDTERNKGKDNDISQSASELKSTVQSLLSLNDSIHSELPFVRREIAWGKIDGLEVEQLFNLMRNAVLPLIGMSLVVDIFDRVGKMEGWQNLQTMGTSQDNTASEQRLGQEERRNVDEWHHIMSEIHDPIWKITNAMQGALGHILIRLEFDSAKRQKQFDTEADIYQEVAPGDDDYAAFLRENTRQFHASRRIALLAWCREKGIDIDTNKSLEECLTALENFPIRDIDQRQVFLILYMEFLMTSAGEALYDLLTFVESTMNKRTRSRLIFPGITQIRKFIRDFRKDSSGEDESAVLLGEGQVSTEKLIREAVGDNGPDKNPEHYRPRNKYERVGNTIRRVGLVLVSPNSIFGLRCAVATMSVAIIALLKNSRQFFLDHRLLWATIMVSFSMFRTSGQTAWNFLLRIVGTVFTTIVCFAIWYIAQSQPGAAIPLLFIYFCVCFYVVVKIPKYLVVGFISAITAVLIVGYELAEAKVGRHIIELNDQKYFPLYLLAPFRLLNVCGGLLVAYIWTVFPYQITEREVIRKDLGGALYLLARYFSVIHRMIEKRIAGTFDAVETHNLEMIRSTVFTKTFGLSARLKASGAFTKWNINLGGPWPEDIYNDLTNRVDAIFSYTSIMGLASRVFDETNHDHEHAPSPWVADLRRLIQQTGTTSHEITLVLCLLGSSLLNGQPLPPYIPTPQPYALAKKLQAIDKDILSVRHIHEEAYAAFAVMQIASRTVLADLEILVDDVKILVGEIQFKSE